MVNRGALFGCLFALGVAASQAAPSLPSPILMPLVFEATEKTGGPTRFTARGHGVQIGLTSSVLQFTIGRDSFNLSWLGGNAHPNIAGEGPLSGRSHYFLGNNAANGEPTSPQYSRVRYRNVYPKIDLVFYSRDGMLEYDFELAPGADPAQIRLAVNGPRDVHLDASGDLVINLPRSLDSRRGARGRAWKR